MSRAQLARGCRVSARLLAEFERGERPNVSLETALTLLNTLGITVRLTTPAGETTALRSPVGDAIGRAARAEYRRRNWIGQVLPPGEHPDDPHPGPTPAARLAAVAEISERAYAVGRARGRSP